MELNGARRKNATRETTSVLKAWLNEHKKNPYPTKGEKIMLAIITKMTLTQVSTWFANARRRLKKENKMTWEPKNRVDDDDANIVDDDDDDNKSTDGKDLLGKLKTIAEDFWLILLQISVRLIILTTITSSFFLSFQIQRTRVPLQVKTVTIINHIALTTTIQEVDHPHRIYVINQVAVIHYIIRQHFIITGQQWVHR